MFNKLFRTLFGSKNKRELKRMGKTVNEINQLEDDMIALSDDQVKEKTVEFRQRLADGETLDK